MNRNGPIRTHGIILWCLLALITRGQETQPSQKHDASFWRTIVANGMQVPDGLRAYDLIIELEDYFGSPDPVQRDTYAYELTTRWVYRDHLLTPDEMKGLMRRWIPLLRTNIGESGTDSVLRRSFAALNLATLAAADNEMKFLAQNEWRDLFDAALRYSRDEKDVRGFVEKKGWHHSVAHTADLLKFLARSKNLTFVEARTLIAALIAKNQQAAAALTDGEDERMAAVLVSLTRRSDFVAEDFAAHFTAIPRAFEDLWKTVPFDAARFTALQNTKRFLRAAYFALAEEPEGNDEAHALAKAIAGVLKKV